jgi:hypothetical protein
VSKHRKILATTTNPNPKRAMKACKQLQWNQPSPIAEFLTQLGSALLKENRRSWMDTNEIADFCESQRIQWDGKHPQTGELEAALQDYFKLAGEFHAPGLTLDGYERRVGWETVFQIRVYPFGPLPQSTNCNTEEVNIQSIPMLRNAA